MKLTANYPAWTKQNVCCLVENITSTSLSRLQKQCNTQQGFSYIEVLVAMFIIAIALVPAMEALQSGIQGAGIHQQTTQQHYLLLSRMENLMATSYGDLLLAAETAGNATTPSSYSDPAGQSERIIVYLSLYDADADPFTIADPDTDADNNIYTGDTANLLWIKAQLENSAYEFESLRSQ